MKNLKLMILFATALGFASCSSDEDLVYDQDSASEKTITLTADMAQFTSNGTRTAINSTNNVVWSDGDQIEIYTADGTYHKTFTLSGGEGTTNATFKGVWDENQTPKAAFYPASECTGYSSTSGFTADIANTQVYTEGTVGNGAFPMVGNISGSSISFKNAFGLLKLSLTGTDAVRGIVLTDNTNPLAGKFTIAADGTTTKSTTATDLTYKAILNCGSNVTLNESTATDFYIAVPAGALSAGFDVQVLNSYGHPMAFLNTTLDNTIVRNKITAMPAKTIAMAKLPEGYTEVATLTSVSASNQPYIDPLYPLTTTTKMEEKVYSPYNGATHVAGNYCYFDMMKGNSNGYYWSFRMSSGSSYSQAYSKFLYNVPACILNLDYNSTTITGHVNGYYVAKTTPTTHRVGQGYNVALFASFKTTAGTNGAENTYAPYTLGRGDVTIYYSLIYDGTELQRHLIPCLRTSDTKPGMYDLKNGVFYTNANNGSDFTYETTYDNVTAKSSEGFNDSAINNY